LQLTTHRAPPANAGARASLAPLESLRGHAVEGEGHESTAPDVLMVVSAAEFLAPLGDD